MLQVGVEPTREQNSRRILSAIRRPVPALQRIYQLHHGGKEQGRSALGTQRVRPVPCFLLGQMLPHIWNPPLKKNQHQ